MLEIHAGCAHDFILSILQVENKKQTPISTVFFRARVAHELGSWMT